MIETLQFVATFLMVPLAVCVIHDTTAECLKEKRLRVLNACVVAVFASVLGVAVEALT